MQLHSRQINKNMQTPGGFKGSKARGQKDSRGKLRPRKKAEGLRVYTLDRRKRRVACHSSREWWVYTLDRIEDNFIRSQETMQESKRLANLIRIELGENLALQYKKMKRTSVPEPAEPKQLKQVRFGSWWKSGKRWNKATGAATQSPLASPWQAYRSSKGTHPAPQRDEARPSHKNE